MQKVSIEGQVFQGAKGKATNGGIVTLKFVDNIPGTDRALYVFHEDEHIGYGKADSSTVATNCIGADDLFDKVPEQHRNEFVGSVADVQNGVRGDVLTISVDLLQFQPASPDVVSDKELILKVSGSIRSHRAKTAVISAFKAGKSVSVTLTEGDEEDNGVLLTYDGMLKDKRGAAVKAGVIRPVGTELDELKELLKSMKTIKANVTEATESSYTLQVKVDADVMEAVSTGSPIPDVDSITEQLVNDGITTAETVNGIVDYLQKCDVAVKTIIKVLKSYKKYDDETAELIPEKPATPFVDDNGFVKRSVVYLLGNATNALRFTGDAGTGKNTLITQLAWVFQRPLMEKAVNSDIDKYDLLGTKTTDSTVDEHGNVHTKIVFEAENLIKAMKVGGFFNLDEINMGDAGVLSLIHPILDGRGYIDVPGYGRVVAHENFRAFSTMNIGYSGTQELNTATADRFTTLNFEAKKSILSILNSHADTRNASANDINIADQLYQGIYRMVVDQDLEDKCLTIRGFIRAVSYAEDLGIRLTLIDNVANRVDVPEYRQQIVDFIDTIC